MIGWYVHHHGEGHLRHLRAIAPSLKSHIHVFSSLSEPSSGITSQAGHVRWTHLEPDVSPAGDAIEPDASGFLHWAPKRLHGHTRRMATIARHAVSLSAMVVDVSAEVTILSRLLGLPTISFTLAGDRRDAPHLRAYELSDAILVPLPMPQLFTPGLIREVLPHIGLFAPKAHFVGGIALESLPTQSSNRPQTQVARGLPQNYSVVVLGSRGGSSIDRELVSSIQASSKAHIAAIGMDDAGWVSDVLPHLREADLVISSAGLGAISDIASSRTPAIFIPQERPFNEQAGNARLLLDLGVGVVDDPREVASWDSLFERVTENPNDRLTQWVAEGASVRAASIIERIAEPS